jgi:hypothetical protein
MREFGGADNPIGRFCQLARGVRIHSPVAAVGNTPILQKSGRDIMKGLLLAAAGMAALFGLGATAEAGHKHHGHGHAHVHGHHNHYPSGFGLSFGFGGYPVYASPVAPIYRPPVYHDTTHYDYHPPTIYRHRNHYHVAPGHYDLHRSGHWHH